MFEKKCKVCGKEAIKKIGKYWFCFNHCLSDLEQKINGIQKDIDQLKAPLSL